MDRALPEYNRILNKKWNDYTKKIHRVKLYQVKPCVDNSPPRSHLQGLVKAKKEQQTEGIYFNQTIKTV